MTLVFGSSLWDILYYLTTTFFRFTKTRISNKVRYTWFFRTFWRRLESMSQSPYSFVCQFTVSFPTSESCYKCFSYNDIFFTTLGLRSFLVRCITYGNNVWKLGFVFVRHCDVFFLSSQLPYLFVPCSYNCWWCWNYVLFWYVRITYGNDVKVTFCVCSSLWRIFYFVAITLFVCSM